MNEPHVSGNAESSNRKGGLNRRNLLSGLAMLPAAPTWLAAKAASAQQDRSAAVDVGVYAESVPMMELPAEEVQLELNQLFVEMFGLVMTNKIAGAVVKRDVKTIFDPVTKELIKVVMPFE